MRQLLYLVYYTIHEVLFYLWRIVPVQQHCKILKYYEPDCLKTFLLLSTLPMMIQVSEKSVHLAKKG